VTSWYRGRIIGHSPTPLPINLLVSFSFHVYCFVVVLNDIFCPTPSSPITQSHTNSVCLSLFLTHSLYHLSIYFRSLIISYVSTTRWTNYDDRHLCAACPTSLKYYYQSLYHIASTHVCATCLRVTDNCGQCVLSVDGDHSATEFGTGQTVFA